MAKHQSLLMFALITSSILLNPIVAEAELYRYKDEGNTYVVSKDRPLDKSHMVITDQGRFLQFVPVTKLPGIEWKALNLPVKQQSLVTKQRVPKVTIQDINAQTLPPHFAMHSK